MFGISKQDWGGARSIEYRLGFDNLLWWNDI